MKFTRKNYLELFLDDIPVIASSKSSNRHTSVIEAGEHAEEYAREINAPGDYEVRVDGGLYYVVKITDIVFDPTIPEPTPPAPEAELALDAASYIGNENDSIAFTIERTGDLNSVVDIDWAITNANATPVIGTERFQISIASILVTVNTGEVGPTEIGDVTLSNVVTISGAVNNTLGAQFTATFTIIDLNLPLADFFVNKSGNNSNDGLTKANAKLTIGAGITLLSAGKILEIGPGVYVGSSNYIDNVPNGTAWDNAVTIRAESGDAATPTVTIEAVSGSEQRPCHLIDNSYVIIQNGIHLTGVNGTNSLHMIV